MEVKIVRVMAVDALAQIGCVLIRCTAVNGIGQRQCAVDMAVGARARKEAHLIGASGSVFGLGDFSHGVKSILRGAGSGKTAQAYSCAIFDMACGLFGRQNRK